MTAFAPLLFLLPLFCFVAAVAIGWWRFRVVSRYVRDYLPWFSFTQLILSAMLMPVALIADWTGLSWAAYHWISPEPLLAAAELSSALLLQGVFILVLACGYVLACLSGRAVHLPSPWLDKLIAARNSTGLGALE